MSTFGDLERTFADLYRIAGLLQPGLSYFWLY